MKILYFFVFFFRRIEKQKDTNKIKFSGEKEAIGKCRIHMCSDAKANDANATMRALPSIIFNVDKYSHILKLRSCVAQSIILFSIVRLCAIRFYLLLMTQTRLRFRFTCMNDSVIVSFFFLFSIYFS